jgi:hypothetical protein
MPRMTAIIERWVRTCRRELLDRTLIWNQRHLLYALREFTNVAHRVLIRRIRVGAESPMSHPSAAPAVIP